MRASHLRHKTSGIALIWTLLLFGWLSLMMMLSVGFVGGHMAASYQRKMQLQCEQIAFFGLQKVIADVQKTLGPDCRVTGSAELLAKEDDKQLSPLCKEHLGWLGVWKSGSDWNSRKPHERTFVKWLVSVTNDHLDAVLKDDFASTVKMAEPERVSFPPEITGRKDAVFAEKIPIFSANTQDVIGHYAYWIEDLGQTDAHEGVLSDGMQGGDKEDLLAFIAKPEHKNTPILKDVPDAKLVASIGGTWGQLNEFYQLGKSLNTDNLTPHPFLFPKTNDTFEGDWGKLIANNTVDDDTQATCGIYPIPIQCAIGYHCSKAGNSILLHGYFGVAVWNPYDRTMESEKYQIRYVFNKNQTLRISFPKSSRMQHIEVAPSKLFEKTSGISGTFETAFAPGEVQFFTFPIKTVVVDNSVTQKTPYAAIKLNSDWTKANLEFSIVCDKTVSVLQNIIDIPIETNGAKTESGTFTLNDQAPKAPKLTTSLVLTIPPEDKLSEGLESQNPRGMLVCNSLSPKSYWKWKGVLGNTPEGFLRDTTNQQPLTYEDLQGRNDIFSAQQLPLFHFPKLKSLADLRHFASPMGTVPTYAIGNSYYLQGIPREEIKSEKKFLYDIPFLLNEHLWDCFFVQPEKEPTKKKTQPGSFNINTTSADAWNRFLKKHLLKKDVKNVLNQTLSFDEKTIKILAKHIAKQASLRAPWMSLADFVNRRILETANDPNGLSKIGALQAAIDLTKQEIVQTNSPFLDGNSLSQSDLLAILSPYVSPRSDTLKLWIYADTSPVAPQTTLFHATIQRTSTMTNDLRSFVIVDVE